MVKPKKHLGQHFLKDSNIAGKIVNQLSPSTKNIIEIGPGTGILTRHLLSRPESNLYLVEIDSESVRFLENQFPGLANRIIHADFLKFDPATVIVGKFAVIGNFPYNISSQILFKILDYKDMAEELVGMFQKEVAERIVSPPGSKKYGILSVLTQVYYKAEKLFEVSPHVFFPEPKVRSAVIRLQRNDMIKPVKNDTTLFSLVKSAFNQRRKTLKNALKGYPFPAGTFSSPLFARRAEQLTIEDYIDLADLLEEIRLESVN